tara:strand:- start:71023 stop:71421 length:399 start_codon:yes stop_codon:yes gene_type:complete
MAIEIDKLNLKKLLEAYDKHGHLIIGVDFDNTIYPLDKKREEICHSVRELLKECKEHSKLCLYTVADENSLRYKATIMGLWGIPPDYINESPIQKWGYCVKPYFNILLDDKAGLTEAFNLLKQFNSKLLNNV